MMQNMRVGRCGTNTIIWKRPPIAEQIIGHILVGHGFQSKTKKIKFTKFFGIKILYKRLDIPEWNLHNRDLGSRDNFHSQGLKMGNIPPTCICQVPYTNHIGGKIKIFGEIFYKDY